MSLLVAGDGFVACSLLRVASFVSRLSDLKDQDALAQYFRGLLWQVGSQALLTFSCAAILPVRADLARLCQRLLQCQLGCDGV